MDLLNANEIDAGGGYITDRGKWIDGFSETVEGKLYTGYALNDIVHTDNAVYLSLVDENTTNPDTDTTASWRKFVDKATVMEWVKTKQPYIGSDGYWYVYNPSTGNVEKTDNLANGGMIMPSVYRDGNDLVIDGGIGDPTGKFVQENNDLIINF
ncbi:MAG: hypothetical protein ACI3Y0_00395 [Prevotella sp.]